MKEKLYKIHINIAPLLRGAFHSSISVLRKDVSFGSHTRIKKNTEWKLFPGCHYSSGNNLIVGKDVTINVAKEATLVIGDNVGIGNRCQIVSHNHIEIGEGTVLAPGVMVYDHNHEFDFDNGVSQRTFIDGQVKIVKHCWIGAGCIILKDVKIGDNCVIGAGSVVTKDIPSYSIAVGTPAKVLKSKK